MPYDPNGRNAAPMHANFCDLTWQFEVDLMPRISLGDDYA
jgi:hypothetical protein